MNTQKTFTAICLSLVLCSVLFAQLMAIDRAKLVNPADIMKSETSMAEPNGLDIMTMTMNASVVKSNYLSPLDFDQLLQETKQDLDRLERFIAAYSSKNEINMNKRKSARQSK